MVWKGETCEFTTLHLFVPAILLHAPYIPLHFHFLHSQHYKPLLCLSVTESFRSEKPSKSSGSSHPLSTAQVPHAHRFQTRRGGDSSTAMCSPWLSFPNQSKPALRFRCPAVPRVLGTSLVWPWRIPGVLLAVVAPPGWQGGPAVSQTAPGPGMAAGGFVHPC